MKVEKKRKRKEKDQNKSFYLLGIYLGTDIWYGDIDRQTEV